MGTLSNASITCVSVLPAYDLPGVLPRIYPKLGVELTRSFSDSPCIVPVHGIIKENFAMLRLGSFTLYHRVWGIWNRERENQVPPKSTLQLLQLPATL